ncbi:hypothetical protein FAGAP_8471 [Fusarium agapanthi]|uniref:DUF6546 domain-containing protein n=1 Tax=Fusarium agapanthi TaxID=1803897 RepID=A0A9P5B4G3_9HYPO|nr:hypothetical protein FAGAP_8471 [Fusarium agapanthi]
MASWTSLPPEIRRMVLQAVISPSPSPTTPVLATVSREWQDFFERSTFKDLALTNGDLYAFASAIKRNTTRLGYIRTLRLRINLMPYSNRLQGTAESATNITQNNRIFTQAIAVLLNVLSLWRGDYGGLELELDARSPSDCTYFNFIHELHDDFLFRFQDEDELFYAGLVVRRAAPRLIALESLGKIIRESLMALEYFSYSTYMELTDDKERDFLDGLSTQLLPSLPTTLKRFSYSRKPFQGSCDPWVINSPLSLLFARACHRFTEFRPPQDLRLRTFFDEIIAGGKCEESKLEKLSINCIFLSRGPYQERVTYILMSAAQVAATMPRLRTMELWCSYPGYGFLFRCEIDDYRVKITWRYLRNGRSFVLEEQVVQEWEKVASPRLLSVNNTSFDDTGIKWKRGADKGFSAWV